MRLPPLFEPFSSPDTWVVNGTVTGFGEAEIVSDRALLLFGRLGLFGLFFLDAARLGPASPPRAIKAIAVQTPLRTSS
jgi:hypothetical protein